jgi:CHAT domain-containing protein
MAAGIYKKSDSNAPPAVIYNPYFGGFLTMAATRDKPREEHGRRAFISWRRLAYASVLGAVLVVGVLLFRQFRATPVERGMLALVEAFAKQRLIEPRLTGGFVAGEFQSSTEDRSLVDTRELDRAADLIMDALAAGDSSAQLPYSRLLLSKDENLPEALKYLRRVVAGSPESAEARNDLGVCFIQQGKLEDAIDEFERALKLKPDLPEALFNRALCFKRLLLSDAADADLAKVIEIERDKSWLREAKSRREQPTRTAQTTADIITDLNEALSGDRARAREIVDRHYAVVRRHFFFEVAQQFLDSAHENVDLASSRMEQIASLAAEAKDDHDIADTVKRLKTVPDQQRAYELQLLRDYKAGLELFQKQRFDEARILHERLYSAFQSRGDTLFQAKTKYAIAQSLYQSRLFTASVRILDDILPLFESRGCRYHQAQTLNLIGLNYSRLGRDSKAFTYILKSSELFQKMREPVAVQLQYVGISYWHLGNFGKALENFRKSTSLFLEQGSQFGDLAYNYLNVADVYRLLDKSRLALLFAEAALKYSNEAGDLNRAAQVSSFEAVQYANAGEMELAATKITQAFTHLEGVDSASRSYTHPLVLTRAGEVAALRGDLAGAIEQYAEAETLTSKAEGDPILHINALRGRAAAYANAGQTNEARKDLDDAISIIEGYRKNLIGRVHRMEFLGASQSAFDQMVVLDVAQPERAKRAFEMSERSRARSLLDDFAPAESNAGNKGPISLDRIQAALPDNLTVLAYSVTDEQTYIFSVTRSEFRVARSRATRRELERLVNDYVSDVRNKDSAIEGLSAQSRNLHELLIDPVKDLLTGRTAVCIIPDKSLQRLPMAALIDSAGRYLIDRYDLTFAPSASVLSRCIGQAGAQVGGSAERFLAVGDPAFSQKDFPNLRTLEDARREAEETSAFYPRPVVLTKENATEADVRKALKDCNVAHIAAHCIVEPQSPWLSALLLAPESGAPVSNNTEPGDASLSTTGDSGLLAETPKDNPADGLLYLNEIYNLKLPVTRMVVLSACETALGQYYRGEGIVSLIHPFLAARVSTVVGSLWPVDSQATNLLMTEFHKARRTTGKRAGNALRTAQLKMIADFPHPYYWAAFIVVGGDY